LLQQASEEAVKATRFPRRPNPESAWTALGNAREDLAFLLNEDPAANYVAALEAHQKASELRPDQAQGWLDRGRVAYRLATLKGNDPTLLRQAQADLLGAASSARRASPAERLSAHDWLGAVSVALRDYTAAKGHFQAGLELLRREPSPELTQSAFRWMEWALAEARQAKAKEVATCWAEAVRERAGLLEMIDPIQAALLQAQSYEVLGRPAEALRVYNAALPEPVTKEHARYARLLIARGYLLISDRHREALRREKVPNLQSILRDADLAVELTFNAGLSNYVKGAALGLAGLARKALALIPGTKPAELIALYQQSVEQLREALRLAPADPNRTFWRIELAVQLSVLMYDPALPADQWRQYRHEALDQLRKASEESNSKDVELLGIIERNRRDILSRKRD
jgi:hypothetical protein